MGGGRAIPDCIRVEFPETLISPVREALRGVKLSPRILHLSRGALHCLFPPDSVLPRQRPALWGRAGPGPSSALHRHLVQEGVCVQDGEGGRQGMGPSFVPLLQSPCSQLYLAGIWVPELIALETGGIPSQDIPLSNAVYGMHPPLLCLIVKVGSCNGGRAGRGRVSPSCRGT